MAISTRKKSDTAEKPGRRTSRESKFSVKLIEQFIDDLKSGRLPLPKVTIADEEQPGLHCMIRPTGNASFHVQYYNKEGKRPYFLIGRHAPGEVDHLTIDRARHLAKTIRALADKGVDVDDGLSSLRAQVLHDVEVQGEKWRPALSKRK